MAIAELGAVDRAGPGGYKVRIAFPDRTVYIDKEFEAVFVDTGVYGSDGKKVQRVFNVPKPAASGFSAPKIKGPQLELDPIARQKLALAEKGEHHVATDIGIYGRRGPILEPIMGELVDVTV